MKKMYACIFMLSSFSSFQLYAQEGKIDSSFGTNGYAYGGIIASGAGGRPNVLIQPDQKILQGSGPNINGNFDIELVRFMPDGTPDVSFNGNGKLLLDLGSKEVPQCIALQSDGKIIVGGQKDGLVMLVRLNADGSLDNSFNGQGWKQYNLLSIGGEQYASGIVVQPDGKIVAACSVFMGLPNVKDFIVMRVDESGNLDPSFNGKGVQKVDIAGGEDYAVAVAIGTDNKITVAGLGVPPRTSSYQSALVRLMPDGSLDPSFGVNGKAVFNIGEANDNLNDLLLQPDGKILFGGHTYRTATNYDFFVARLLADGTLDNSFGTGGVTFKDFDNGLDYAWGLDLQGDGKIVQSGNALVTNEPAFCTVVRYTSAGIIDSTFGTNGYTPFDLGAGHAFYGGAPLQNVKVQQDDKIVASGLARIPDGQFGYLTNENVLVRLTGTAPLPISDEVSNFEGRFAGKFVFLNWRAENNNSISQFNILRSVDSVQFDNVGSEPAVASKKHPYSFKDPVQDLLTYQKLFYRLEVVDTDGTKSYSNIIAVDLSKGKDKDKNKEKKNELLTITNLSQSHELTVQYMAEHQQRGTILVYTSDGKLIARKDVMIVQGRNNWITSLPSNVNGILIVQLRIGNEIITKQVIK